MAEDDSCIVFIRLAIWVPQVCFRYQAFWEIDKNESMTVRHNIRKMRHCEKKKRTHASTLFAHCHLGLEDHGNILSELRALRKSPLVSSTGKGPPPQVRRAKYLMVGRRLVPSPKKPCSAREEHPYLMHLD